MKIPFFKYNLYMQTVSVAELDLDAGIMIAVWLDLTNHMIIHTFISDVFATPLSLVNANL